jgi:hypothetical protein
MLIEIAHQKTWLPIPNPMFFGVFDNMVPQDTMVLLHLPRIYIFRTDFYLFRRNRKSISICWQGTAPFFPTMPPAIRCETLLHAFLQVFKTRHVSKGRLLGTRFANWFFLERPYRPTRHARDRHWHTRICLIKFEKMKIAEKQKRKEKHAKNQGQCGQIGGQGPKSHPSPSPVKKSMSRGS